MLPNCTSPFSISVSFRLVHVHLPLCLFVQRLVALPSGGRLICDTVTANVVDFQTNGGAISIKRLVGKQCSLDARPTAASLDAPGTAEDTTAVDTERYYSV